MKEIKYAPREIGGKFESPLYSTLLGYIVDEVTIKSKVTPYDMSVRRDKPRPNPSRAFYQVEFPARDRALYEGANKLDLNHYTADMLFNTPEECKRYVDALNKNITYPTNWDAEAINHARETLKAEQEFATQHWGAGSVLSP